MNKVYLGIVVIIAFACMAVGQTKGKQKTAPLADEPNGQDRVMLASGTSISAELQKTLDVNKAQVGDQVVLRTTGSIKQDGEVVIPKGTSLIGRVTDVKRRTKDAAGSRIGLIFDRIQNRELSLPITATLVSITEASTRTAVDDTLMSDSSVSSRTSTSGANSGGGLLGGVTNTVGGLVHTTSQTAGAVTNSAGQTLGNTTQTLGRTLSGIQISSELSGSSSSSATLSSPNRDIRISKGATFHLRVSN